MSKIEDSLDWVVVSESCWNNKHRCDGSTVALLVLARNGVPLSSSVVLFCSCTCHQGKDTHDD